MNTKRVLIVDDSKDSQSIMQLSLETFGYVVETASSVEDGIKKMEANPPDLILLDYVMPESYGSELVKYVRQHRELSKICIVMLTGATYIATVDHTVSNVNAIVYKPVENLQVFLELIQLLLEQSS